MKITNAQTSNPIQDPHAVEAKRLCDTANAEVIHMNLKPGQSLRKHTAPTDAFFYILEGTGTGGIGEEKLEVGKDTLVESPRNIPRLLSNTWKDPFRFLVVKVPKKRGLRNSLGNSQRSIHHTMLG